MDRWTDQIHKFWKKVLEDKVTRDCKGAQARKINMLLSFCGCSKYFSPWLSTFKCNKTIPKHIVYWWEPGSYPKTCTISLGVRTPRSEFRDWNSSFCEKKLQHFLLKFSIFWVLYFFAPGSSAFACPHNKITRTASSKLHPISQAISVPVVTWRWDMWTRASSGFHWSVWGCLVEGFSWTNSNED